MTVMYSFATAERGLNRVSRIRAIRHPSTVPRTTVISDTITVVWVPRRKY